MNEEQIAELVAAVLAGRPELLMDTVLGTLPPEVRVVFRQMMETAMGKVQRDTG